MQTAATLQPEPTEYAPYYGKYTALVPEGDIINTLTTQLDETLSFLRGLSEEQGDSVYAPGKWSLKDVVGHIIDTERVFSHRAFRFARADATPLPGYEQDDYARAGNYGRRSLSDITDELELVRRCTIHMFRSLDEEAWLRRGVANDNEVSVRALAYILAGHETHHINIIRERYL